MNYIQTITTAIARRFGLELQQIPAPSTFKYSDLDRLRELVEADRDGRLQTRTWEDKQGNKRKTTEVVADEVFFAEGKKQQEDEGSGAFVLLPPDDDLLPGDDIEIPF